MADLDVYRGDTNVFNINVIRQNVPVDLTAVKMWFTAKENVDDADVDAIISLNSVDDPSQIVFTQPTNGKAQITLIPTDTSGLDRTALVYDVQIKEGSVITTVASGKLRITKDVTLSV